MIRSVAPGRPSQTVRLFLLVLAILMAPALPAGAGGFSWSEVAEAVAVELDDAVAAYRAGDSKETKRALTRAYFGVFEGRKMEAALRKTLGQTHTFQVERQFAGLRRVIGKQPAESLAEKAAALAEQLRKDAVALDAAGVPAEVYDAR